MTSTARSVALGAIRRVTDDGAYSNLVIPAMLGRSGLSGRDRAFAAELAYGTLRKLVPLDWTLERLADRPVGRMSPTAKAALRIGAYQLRFAGVAPHAAVGETVSLVGPRERGFVNAILRRAATGSPPWPEGDRDEDVAVRTGLVAWAVRELRRVVDPGEVEAAAQGFGERGSLSLRANHATTTTEALEEILRGSGLAPRRSAVHPDCLLLDGGDPTRLAGWDEGWFAVQDEASAFVTGALECVPGNRVLDVCAGPGGKAGHLSALVGDAGLVVAADLHPRRAELVRRSAARLRVHPVVLAQDAAAPAVRGPFDRILVDAPCSGIGSSRRRPELLWRGRRQEASRLARLQVEIASAASDLLAPGGRLVYSVCTFPKAETDAACDAILRHRPELEASPILGPHGEAARVRLWPHRDGTDGMFVAAFTRRA
jgi:16S rRNA (cytosine967-C5)-methyltransferase